MWKRKILIIAVILLLFVSAVYATGYNQALTETFSLGFSTPQHIQSVINELDLGLSTITHEISISNNLNLLNSIDHVKGGSGGLSQIFGLLISNSLIHTAKCNEHFVLTLNITSNGVVIFSTQGNGGNTTATCEGGNSPTPPSSGSIQTYIVWVTTTVFNNQVIPSAKNLGDATANTFVTFFADAFGTLFILFLTIYLTKKANLPNWFITLCAMLVLWPCAVMFALPLWLPLFVNVGGFIVMVGIRNED